MKSYINIVLIGFSFLVFNNEANAQNWIPYQGYQNHTVTTTYNFPVVVQQVQPQPVIFYQWTPYIVPQTTVIEHQCLFRRTQKVVTEPIVQWFYVPTVIYK